MDQSIIKAKVQVHMGSMIHLNSARFVQISNWCNLQSLNEMNKLEVCSFHLQKADKYSVINAFHVNVYRDS